MTTVDNSLIKIRLNTGNRNKLALYPCFTFRVYFVNSCTILTGKCTGMIV